METEQYIALIIDDDSTATSELRKGLAAHPEFTVAGAATTATAGERLLFRLRPDILFLDVELPDADKWAVEEQETAEGYRLVLKTNAPDAIGGVEAGPQPAIYSEAGRVCVSAEAGTAIRIYSADGRLLREATAGAGTSAFGGLQGMVIVSAGDTTKKITVKQ